MKRLILLVGVLLMVACDADSDLFRNLLSPSKVALVFPEDNSECTTGTVVSETESEVVFSWTDAEVGDGYELTLTNLTTGRETTYESESSSMPITLLRGTPYQWTVTTVMKESSDVATSDTSAFYNSGPGTESFIPFPAAAISPKNGELVANTVANITLEWQASDLDDDIIAYDVYFGTDNPPSLYAEGHATNSLGSIPVAAGETYYWMILTRDEVGNESTSEVFFFEKAN